MSIRLGSWFGTCACIERITASRSAWPASFGKMSLISRPLWPCLAKPKGDGSGEPVFRSVVKLTGAAWSAYLASAGLGSKVSTCDGPPFKKKWITRLARGAK
jgi:hypothetical protein